MAERIPVTVLLDELGTPVGLREFPAGDTLPESMIPVLPYVPVAEGKQLSTEDYTTEEKEKLGGIDAGAQVNAVVSVAGKTGAVTLSQDDVGLDKVDNTRDADKPLSTAGQAALDTKVDKVPGKGLSDANFTADEKDKLAALEGSHWRGQFVSLAALQTGVADPVAGDYADVDAGTGEDVRRHIWDATDSAWVVQSGEVAPITAAQVKQLYEANPDTNAFSDDDVGKLGGIQSGATANATDEQLRDRSTHTGEQPISTVTGLQDELDTINTAMGDVAAVLDAINGEAI